MQPNTLDFTGLTQPTAIRFEQPITDEELMAFSRRNRPWRFERESNGDITIMTPVGGLGGIHESHVSAHLYNWNNILRTGIVFAPDTGFTLPDGATLAPDSAWIPKAQWDALTHQQKAGFLPFCPHFLVEVRSPSDSRKTLEAKMNRWLANGAQLAWLIDPIDQQVLIYQPNQPIETLDRPDSIHGHGPLATFTLDLTPIWELD